MSGERELQSERGLGRQEGGVQGVGEKLRSGSVSRHPGCKKNKPGSKKKKGKRALGPLTDLSSRHG